MSNAGEKAVSRLVVISNRVPLPSERGGARAGGLAVALADVLRPGSLWFGWSGRRSANADATAHIQQADRISYATIDLTEHEYRAFYLNFANGALWPLLHFRLGLLDFKSEDYDGYRAVNRQYAASLVPLLRPDDIVACADATATIVPYQRLALGPDNRLLSNSGSASMGHELPCAIGAAIAAPRRPTMVRRSMPIPAPSRSSPRA